MADPTQLIVSIQGKRGSGKTTLATNVIEPVMALIGAKLDNKTDKASGVFLTYQVPFQFADQALETFSRDMVDRIVQSAIAKDRAEGGPRVSFKNADEIMDLLSRREELEDFLKGDEDGDLSQKIAQQLLSPRLRQVLEPKRVITLLRQDARAQIEEIDQQLEQQGFDTSDHPELPAV